MDAGVLLKKGKTHKPIQLMLQPSCSFSGKVTGATIGSGWRLRATVPHRGMGESFDSIDSIFWSRTSAIARDGDFRIQGMPPGRASLALLIPQIHGRATDLKIDLAPVVFAKSDQKKNLDLGGKLPAVIAGRVELTGAPFRAEKLAVVAIRVEHLNPWSWRENPAIALVSSEGEYRMPVIPGSYVLRALDLETGIILYQSEARWNARQNRPTARNCTSS